MNALLRHKKILSWVLIFCFTALTMGFSTAHAGMVSTAQSLARQLTPERERLNAFLEREDIKIQLQEWGLDKEIAKARVDSLTDEEVSLMAQKLDQLPAGGDGLTVIVGAAVLVFFVLLLTDILGLTDVFPFTK